MKKIIISLSAVLFLLVGCEDTFLDLQDLDSVTEQVYFDEPQNFEDASNYFYRGLHSPKATKGDGFAEITDYGTELNGYVQDYGQGINTATDEDIYWNNAYDYLREVNLLLDKADAYTANGGNAADISKYVATAYFFRAYHHFRLLKRFGGVPIVIEVTNVDSPILFAPRNSRYEVVAQILADLDLAIAGLPATANGADLGKISSIAATAYKARVLLFEGTWEKYVGTATDGDGTNSGAGSTKPSGYPAVDAMFNSVVQAAKAVMDSGQFEIWNKNADPNMENNSYKWLFSIEGADSNPGGYTKASNKEFIIQTIFDYESTNRIGSQFTQINFGRNAPTQVALDMYSTLDGLPINKSTQFQGYAKQSDQFINRDRRMWGNFGELILANGSRQISAIGSVGLSNLSNWKWTTWNNYRSVREEGYNYPHLRYAEVLLTYAEALYERDGSISDADLNLSINLIRARAGIAPLTNTLVTTNNLNMLDEIRRERTVELYMEDNNHWNDIHRWDTAKTLLNDDLIGYVIEGSEYETNTALFNPAIAIYGYKNDYPSGKGPVKALIIDPVSTRIYSQKNYLWPLPINETVINTNLKQNPGW
ncbi:putative outer membrane starch-binding protein [Mariniflexile fucanivorans]|uniref:Putative outer membrane starch-binding protein n=1 Tax=Mariniflexile fucanivorans TaxID=264023 RepID=A0A4V2QE29_9FLAO|nr:RagB/SusD family nutrient uptake outer membrane protein [Mariniflexile fucanivorans]TCL66187.1 putative outer membrane starch-binding protein [Mariniflexile fucanivorans]